MTLQIDQDTVLVREGFIPRTKVRDFQKEIFDVKDIEVKYQIRYNGHDVEVYASSTVSKLKWIWITSRVKRLFDKFERDAATKA